ncbi:MAG: hypothetical protein IE928_08285 [Gammaproteobacteria bacterium]|nr:hypothetical protein [Gammaproteobacteria bacterium]
MSNINTKTLLQMEGGITKRIDENRELFNLLQVKAPEFLQDNPWVAGWLESQDDYLTALKTELEKAGVNIPQKGMLYSKKPSYESSRKELGDAAPIIAMAGDELYAGIDEEDATIIPQHSLVVMFKDQKEFGKALSTDIIHAKPFGEL